ncbi:C4-dicarboxylate TRAP transporter substrate-binding protein [Sphaerochaeta sp. S2]|uniref:C4-dicarboxylate TRAP transporter substrate-binding protein n=1 Tax=Sphaerochaeta sp. S2 TaxID=2798868 RepID=UPI0018E9D8FC|nr:C4-dicarboxylate TRAP transporter substrate-binding protein [Sphaerochaeta sp. S2]MBJ2355460.1 C4-dicarboxylate TRAP transporter substrate-binding protein [Sphaerochaeta sp. S2]
MKKVLFTLLVLALAVMPVMAQGSAEAASGDDYKLVLKMSHVFAPNEQLTKSLDIVVKNISDRTNGAIEIQHYPQSQLAVYKDGVEQVARGADFISVEDPSYLGDYVPDFNALVGPMLYKSFDEYEYMIQTDLVKGMLKELEEEHRIKVLALDYIFGFRNMKTNKVITTPADLQGMKIRTPGSQLFIDTINAMGATATPLGFSETLSAVQQGVVDGLEGTMDAYGSNGSAEVAKNMALTQHFLGTCGVYINVDVFNAIPEEYQTIIEEEFTAGAKHMIGEISNNYEATKAKLEAQGNKFNEVDSAAFAATVTSVYENMKGVTPGIYQILQDELAKMPK